MGSRVSVKLNVPGAEVKGFCGLNLKAASTARSCLLLWFEP